jgi:hypothetical protein
VRVLEQERRQECWCSHLQRKTLQLEHQQQRVLILQALGLLDHQEQELQYYQRKTP